jgi:hypothetical protein
MGKQQIPRHLYCAEHTRPQTNESRSPAMLLEWQIIDIAQNAACWYCCIVNFQAQLKKETADHLLY